MDFFGEASLKTLGRDNQRIEESMVHFEQDITLMRQFLNMKSFVQKHIKG